MKEKDKAYLAGIIDSDGSIMMSYENHGKTKINLLALETKDRIIVPYISNLLNMKYMVVYRNNNPEYKSFKLRIRDKTKIKSVLESIYQYLYTKQPKAKITIDSIKIKKNLHSQYTTKENKLWCELYNQLKLLNQKQINHKFDNYERDHKFHWAWLAGIIDGDGCISVSKFTTSNKAIVTIGMTHEKTIKYIASILKVGYKTKKTGMYVIRLLTKDVLRVIPNVIPYLTFKKELAILAVEISQLRSEAVGIKHENLTIANEKIDLIRKSKANRYMKAELK